MLPNFTPRSSSLCLPSFANFNEFQSLYPAFFAYCFAIFRYSGSPVASSTSKSLRSLVLTSSCDCCGSPSSSSSLSSTPPYIPNNLSKSPSSNPPIIPPLSSFSSAFAYNAFNCAFALAKGSGSLLWARSVPFVKTFQPLSTFLIW